MAFICGYIYFRCVVPELEVHNTISKFNYFSSYEHCFFRRFSAFVLN